MLVTHGKHTQTHKTTQLVDSVRDIGSSLPSEARNVFLRTPEGLETPHYRLLHEGDGVRGVCVESIDALMVGQGA